MSGERRVAVCIVTHGSAADLPACLAAVGRQRLPPAELVVVDCASRDGSLEVARRHAPASVELKCEAATTNLGFTGGMNRALALSHAPMVLMLNADAVLDEGFLERAVHRMLSHRELRVGAVAGRLSRPASGGRPRLDACGMRLIPTWRHLDRGAGQVDRGQYATAERVFGATGAASLFRREALEDAAVDGDILLPELHTFREDAELCLRLRERGWEVLYEPSARAVHRRVNLPGRRRQMSVQINRQGVANRFLLRAYHQGPANLLLTLLPTLWRDALVVGYVLLRERTSLGAFGWLWRHRRRILDRRRKIQARRTVARWNLDRWFFRSRDAL